MATRILKPDGRAVPARRVILPPSVTNDDVHAFPDQSLLAIPATRRRNAAVVNVRDDSSALKKPNRETPEITNKKTSNTPRIVSNPVKPLPTPYRDDSDFTTCMDSASTSERRYRLKPTTRGIANTDGSSSGSSSRSSRSSPRTSVISSGSSVSQGSDSVGSCFSTGTQRTPAVRRKKGAFIWPSGGRQQGTFGRLKDILTGKGPDIFVAFNHSGKPVGPLDGPSPGRWSRWTHHVDDPKTHWVDLCNYRGDLLFAGRRNPCERYDFVTRKYKYPRSGDVMAASFHSTQDGKHRIPSTFKVYTGRDSEPKHIKLRPLED